MMATLQHSIQIGVPLEAVWRVLVDLEQVGFYNPLVTKVKYISTHKTGVGASRECEFKPRGTARERVTALEDLKSISMEMYQSDWPLKFMHWTNHLTEHRGITTVRTITEYKVKFGVLGRAMDALFMKPKFIKILDELFFNMKAYIESKEKAL